MIDILLVVSLTLKDIIAILMIGAALFLSAYLIYNIVKR